MIRGKGDSRRLWAWHGLGVAVVLWWVLAVCEMPFLLFFFGFVYCGTALSRLRSYAEHRFADDHEERTAIVEAVIGMRATVASLVWPCTITLSRWTPSSVPTS